MPVALPVVLCVVGILVSLLPPADVQPAEGRSSWLAMGIATAAVVGIVAVAVHMISTADHSPRATASELAGNP